MLGEKELKRYSRQMMMDGWGDEVQNKLKDKTVFIAGAGGLGSPVSIYLAVAGIGNIRICDFDSPDISNLNRQILYTEKNVGINKAISAKQTLEELNPYINIIAVTEKIVAENIDDLVGNSNIILDCMDNFPTRYLLNECAIRKGIPLVFGSIWGMEGRLSFFNPPETPCFRCVFHESPPKEIFPVVGATPAVIGSLQALETIKYLTGIGENLKNKILIWDGQRVEFNKFKIYKDPKCQSCSNL